MSKKEGIFFGEGRIWLFPFADLNGVTPNTMTNVSNNAAPLQFNMDGDWALHGYSAQYCIPAAGGLPSGTPVNIQIQDQATSENYLRQSNQRTITGAPIEHVAGKAGTPNYMSWPRVLEAGARLYTFMLHQGLATPSGRSPWYVAAHTKFLRPGTANAVPIGSRDMQLERYGGLYVNYSGVKTYTPAAPLVPNDSDDLVVPITGKKYFFVDSLFCRFPTAADSVVNPLNDLFNPLVAEKELLVNVRDTTSLSNWNQPSFAPVWTMFSPFASMPYSPPAPFVVRPLGNIELTLKNGPTANIEVELTFTFGGVLVDLPEKVLREASMLAVQRTGAGQADLIVSTARR